MVKIGITCVLTFKLTIVSEILLIKALQLVIAVKGSDGVNSKQTSLKPGNCRGGIVSQENSKITTDVQKN